MDRPTFTARTLAVFGCFALLAILVVFAVWRVFDPLATRVRIDGAGNYSAVKPYGQFVNSSHGAVMAIWCADAPGPNDATVESSLFGYRFTPVGFFTFADGKRIDWKWEDPRETTGDIGIDGTRYNMAHGALFLVSAKDGRVHVTQLDFDVTQNIGVLAQAEPKIAKFLEEASGQR